MSHTHYKFHSQCILVIFDEKVLVTNIHSKFFRDFNCEFYLAVLGHQILSLKKKNHELGWMKEYMP